MITAASGQHLRAVVDASSHIIGRLSMRHSGRRGVQCCGFSRLLQSIVIGQLREAPGWPEEAVFLAQLLPFIDFSFKEFVITNVVMRRFVQRENVESLCKPTISRFAQWFHIKALKA